MKLLLFNINSYVTKHDDITLILFTRNFIICLIDCTSNYYKTIVPPLFVKMQLL